MRYMKESEERLILKLGHKILSSLKILGDDTETIDYVHIVKSALTEELGLKHIHFLVNKDRLSENNQFFLYTKRKSLSFFGTWQKNLYLKDDINSSILIDYYDYQYQHTPFNKTLIIYREGYGLTGLMLFYLPSDFSDYTLSFWKCLANMIDQYFEKVLQILMLKNENKRIELLQSVTSQFHSSIDIDAVLRKVLASLEEIYPYLDYEVFLSNYNNIENDLPIQTLDYSNNNSVIMQTFLSGNYQIENDVDHINRFLYFPLKGKQGVYGVLKIVAKYSIVVSNEDIEFITKLVYAASSAMENAHLYQQSRQVISDLQLITKVVKKLNSNLRIKDLVHNIAEELQAAFHAEEVGIILFENSDFNVLPGSTPYFNKKDSTLFLQSIRELLETKDESLFFANYESIDPSVETPFRSIMVESLQQDQNRIGFIIVLHRNPYTFSFNTYKLLQSITQHTSLAFTNAMLRRRLEKLVITDYLTNLFTRNYLDEQLQKSIERDEQGTFLLIDIDNFKVVNDTFGHQIGDQILIQIATIIKENLSENDIGARWGGEELAVYLPNSTLEEGLLLGNDLVYLTSIQIQPTVTISCGVSHWKQNKKESPLSLFKRADEALYLAKSRGKNRVIACIK